MASNRLLQIPNECLLLILSRTSLQDLCSLSCTCRELRESIKDPQLWKELAETKWGPEVITLRQGRDTNWIEYVKKRTCTRTIRRSPFQLGQENYQDPWEHLVCCLLCSRTSGSGTIHNAVTRFLTRCSNPSVVLTMPPDEIKALIAHPLGLPDIRYKAVAGMSRAFLAEDWEDVIEFYGCGKFVSDSWRIFCCGDLSGKGVEDINLKRYLRWANTGQTEDPKRIAIRKAVQRLPAAGTLRSGSKRKVRTGTEKEPPAPARRSARNSRSSPQ